MLQVAPRATKAVDALQYQTSVFEIRSLQGLRNAYRSSVHNFARLAAALNIKVKKKKSSRFKLKIVEREGVNILKKELRKPPVPGLQQRDGQHILETDIRGTPASFVVLQEQADTISSHHAAGLARCAT